MTESDSYLRFSQNDGNSLEDQPVLPDISTSQSYNVLVNDRNASPSRSSASASSNVSGLHLKRKNGQQMRHMLNAARPSLTDTNTIPSILPPASHPNHVTIGGSNTAPSPKRPPASHSSYGVGTSTGPPPSFDTRRTSSTERVWRIERPKSLRVALATERVESSQGHIGTLQQSSQEISLSTHEHSHDDTTPPLLQSSPETADTQSIHTPTDVEDLTIMESKGEQGLGVKNAESDAKSSSGSHRSEDLFLNIARTDDRPASSKGERRRSRIGLQHLSDLRSNSIHRSQHSHQLESVQTPEIETPVYRSKRSSLQFGQLRGNEINQDSLTDNSESEHYNKRDTLRPTTRSSVIYRNSRLVSESAGYDKATYGEQNTTESTTSTNAPSTVWDELDDLKSRIRKLELTGKLPPSSAAAMSSAERPRTATTAATTLSSSPKHNKVSTPLQSTFEGISPNTHPLLHESLNNAKQVVSHDVYLKLQATAQDALQLASLTAFDGTAVRSSGQLANERQIRRRTESMCRSLTELAIALAAEQKQAAPSAYRPPTSELSVAGTGNLRSRRYSNDPPSVRIASRLETRRISAQIAPPRLHQVSPDMESPTALPQYPGSGSRISRVPASVRARRAYDGAEDSDAASSNTRPVSRAMTDVSAARRMSRDHTALSREYTAQHPMPDANLTNTNLDATQPNSTRTPLPPNISTNFISRRKTNFSPTTVDGPESSPLAARPSFGRITVVQNADTASDVGRSNTTGTRRSLGFASRLGSSVGNRLRAARTDSRYRQDGMPVDPASVQL